MTMKTVYNVEDFVKYNDIDARRIIKKVFPKVEDRYNMEDIVQHLYLTFFRLKTIERWDPNATASFSTWIYKCISNFLASYYLHVTKKEKDRTSTLSLDFEMADRRGSARKVTLHDFVGAEDPYMNYSLYVTQISKLLKRYTACDIKRTVPYYDQFKYYCNGHSDSDISEAFNLTIAGVGNNKRNLRKLIKKCEDGTILNDIQMMEAMNLKKKLEKETIAERKKVREILSAQRKVIKAIEEALLYTSELEVEKSLTII